MEVIELASLQVAVPVLGVVLCAIMVFVFGFRSPVQPPSFNFEEEKQSSRRRVKQSKPKDATNGRIAVNEPPADVPNLKTSKDTKTSPKSKTPEAKSTKKESKQDVKQDRKEKLEKAKKPTVKEESAKKQMTAPPKKDVEDGGEWTTIQVSKKGKKQKVVPKKDGSRADSAGEAENETEPTPSHMVADASGAAEPEIDHPNSPQITKAKKKKKTTALKVKPEENEQSPIPVKPLSVSSEPISQMEQDIIENKKKKNKKEKKVAAAGAAAASGSESLPQDAAPASGKDVKKESSPLLSPPLEDVQLTKPSPKKKKAKGKENTQAVQEEHVSISEDIQIKPQEKATKPSKKTGAEKKKPEPAAPEAQVEPVVSAVTTPANVPVSISEKSVSTDQPAASISFDEIGDSWIEAAPKSKKKKPRRDN